MEPPRAYSAPVEIAVRMGSMSLEEGLLKATMAPQHFAPPHGGQVGWGGAPLHHQQQHAAMQQQMRYRQGGAGDDGYGRRGPPARGGGRGPPAQQHMHPRMQGPRQHSGDMRQKNHQGYRRLWQQVTQVNRGQKLGEHDGSGFGEMTVEDLLEVVRRLPPEASAVKAVGQALYYFDSGALAALLKELNKSGHVRRAQEIFDWLRGLDETHELYSLCNTMTFTTAISQCGAQQQLRRALELVAEMRRWVLRHCVGLLLLGAPHLDLLSLAGSLANHIYAFAQQAGLLLLTLTLLPLPHPAAAASPATCTPTPPS
jgi:hypothetical protein